MDRPRVLIAYAYGASNEEGETTAAAAIAGMPGLDVEWVTIDWREHLEAVTAQDLSAAADRKTDRASGEVRGEPSTLDRIIGVAQWVPNRVIRRMNKGILVGSGTTIADVMGYESCPWQVRRHVRKHLGLVVAQGEAEGRTVVALGLSLGGIILADVLRRTFVRKPAGLITIGSQYGAYAGSASSTATQWSARSFAPG